MQGLLTDIELDLQELRCLTEAFLREPNAPLRNVLKRTIQQTQLRLSTMLEQLEVIENESVLVVKSVQIETSTVPEIELQVGTPAAPLAETEILAEAPILVEAPILAERIRTNADLRRSISLNDSFRFSRELFDNDTERMNRVLHQIGEMSSYNSAVSFLSSLITVEPENEAMNDLLEHINKYFNVLD